MSHGGPSTAESVVGAFTLSPMPYPVLLILAVLFFFLGLQWYVSYEDMVETAEENMGWALMAVPLVLILAVKLLSGVENPERMLWGGSPWERQRRMRYLGGSGGGGGSEGSSPWGVAAVIVLLLVLVQYQSSFLEGWFGFG